MYGYDSYKDFNPDHHPSYTKRVTLVAEANPDEILMVLGVRGLGVITLHSVNDEFKGIAIYTKAEIGYAPDL